MIIFNSSQYFESLSNTMFINYVELKLYYNDYDVSSSKQIIFPDILRLIKQHFM